MEFLIYFNTERGANRPRPAFSSSCQMQQWRGPPERNALIRCGESDPMVTLDLHGGPTSAHQFALGANGYSDRERAQSHLAKTGELNLLMVSNVTT
jgi:hypothetical protein